MNEKKKTLNKENMSQSDKGKMFLKHCSSHPLDILRLGKATILYGVKGLKSRAGELARMEWDKQKINAPIEEKKLLLGIKFTFVLPVYNIDVDLLKRTLNSIEKQIYKEWEICIVDNGSTSSELHSYLENLENGQIKIEYLKQHIEEGEAINRVEHSAIGEYLFFIKPGDIIYSNALQECGKIIVKTDADLLYGDMDMIDNKGNHILPNYKPDWSPDLLTTQMYIGDSFIIKSKLFKMLGGGHREFGSAYEYDLCLRVAERTTNIQHVAKLLYSKYLIEKTSDIDEKNRIKYFKGKDAVQQYFNNILGVGRALVESSVDLKSYDIRYNIKEEPFVSIIIPTKDHINDLKIALDSIFKHTLYDKFEIIILNNNSELKETALYFEELMKTYTNVSVIDADFEFNWSKLNNYGMHFAKGDVFVFLNNDVKVIEPTWLRRLVENAVRPSIGVAGGLLLYEDNTIQHAGVVIGMGGWADHVYKGCSPELVDSPFISPLATRNVSACTGACMAISRDKIEKIGGFDERFIICGSDVEICLRAIDRGYKNVYIPQVKLYHYESKSRDSYIPQVDYELSDIMYSGYRKGGDPYYNLNLSMDSCIPKVKQITATKDIKMKTKPVNLTDIREIHFKKEFNREYRLNLVLPALNAEYVFGGIATALSCFEAIGKELGCSTRIILIDAEMDQKTKDKYGTNYQIVSSDERSDAKHQIVSMVDRENTTLLVSENDQFMFTAWWSAYIVQTEYRKWKENGKLSLRPFLYLIQDYEPGFYAWSPKYVLAETTYRYEYPQIAIFNSHELKDYILGKGYEFEEVYYFEPLLNSILKEKVQSLDETVFKRKQILVYGRPSVDRNAFEIIVESLRKWIAAQPGAKSWTILSAGEQHDPVELGEGLYLESVGKLTIEQYAKILQESYAGISLMVSPHPSYPPLEMAVFDVQIITNSYGNKDLSYFSSNITSVNDMNPVLIANKLKEICSNYHTVVTHKEVNHDYVYNTNPFGFIEAFKKKIVLDRENY